MTFKEVADVFYPDFMDLVRWWDPPHEARICDVERHYETAIHIYTYNDDLRRDLRGVRWSEITHKKNKNRSILLLYVKGYYFYINNYSALTQVYSCGGCNTMCEGDKAYFNIKEHQKTCHHYNQLCREKRARRQERLWAREEGCRYNFSGFKCTLAKKVMR